MPRMNLKALVMLKCPVCGHTMRWDGKIPMSDCPVCKLHEEEKQVAVGGEQAEAV